MRITLTFIFILFFAPIWTKAEYRAFLLEIKSSEDGEPRLIPSTLDPLQYHYYYPLKPDEKVSYTQTWLCPGHTGHGLPICKNPKENQDDESADPSKSPERMPASK